MRFALGGEVWLSLRFVQGPLWSGMAAHSEPLPSGASLANGSFAERALTHFSKLYRTCWLLTCWRFFRSIVI